MNETIEDIVSEMREYESTPPPRDAWLDLADRIEAAWKREREVGAEAAQICGEIGEIVGRATTEKSSAVGNTAAMREALKQADVLISIATFEEGVKMDEVEKIRAKINAALAAPLRNCDIYDAESCRMAYHINGDGLMTMQAFADWLFAPAEEGATNEQK